MGNMIAGHMEGVMQKNMDMMKQSQVDMLERQMQMNNFMRERQVAMQLAGAREMLVWWGTFYGLSTLGMLKGFAAKKNPAVLVPLLPLTFIVGYQADMAYGGKMNRIRDEADRILQDELGMLRLPGSGLPTVQQLDDLRKK